MHKRFYLYLLLSTLVFAYCTPAKKELKNGEYRTVVTLMKNDTFPTEIQAIEHYNSKGKIIERVRFLPFTPVVIGFEHFFYDSLNNMIYYQRRNSPNFWITAFERNKYNNEGLMSKRKIQNFYSNSFLIFNYDKNRKLIKSVCFDKKDLTSNWKKVLIYNSFDSLNRVETVYWNDSENNSRDSVVYGNNRKTIYSIDAENVQTRKYVVIYRNGKIVHEYKYSNNYLSDKDEFYLDEVKSYFYKDDLLVKKIVKHSPINAWCGTGNDGYTEVFTYFYE